MAVEFSDVAMAELFDLRVGCLVRNQSGYQGKSRLLVTWVKPPSKSFLSLQRALSFSLARSFPRRVTYKFHVPEIPLFGEAGSNE